MNVLLLAVTQITLILLLYDSGMSTVFSDTVLKKKKKMEDVRDVTVCVIKM